MKKSHEEIYATEIVASDHEQDEDEYGNEVFADQLEMYDEDDPNGDLGKQLNPYVAARIKKD